MIVNEAKEAGKKAGCQAAEDFISQELEALLMPDIIKICEENGKAKGEEVWHLQGVSHGHEKALFRQRERPPGAIDVEI